MAVLRREATSGWWGSRNPVLADGEFGVELDTGLSKIGDGSTAWNALSYSDELDEIDASPLGGSDGDLVGLDGQGGFKRVGSGTYLKSDAPTGVVQVQTPAAVVSTMQSGSDFTIVGGAGSSDLNDTTTFARGTQSAKIVTDAAGTFATLGAVATTAVDLTARNIRLTLRADDIDHLDRIEVYAASGGSFANRYTIQFGLDETDQHINYFKSGEFVSMTLSVADASVTGSPNRAAIDTWQLRVKDDAVSAVTVWWQAVEVVDQSSAYGSGVVSFTFDDTEESTYTLARPSLDRYGFLGTAYVIKDNVGDSGRMTLTQLQKLYELGWDIAAHAAVEANHSSTNAFLDLSDDELVEELSTLKRWLVQTGFARSADHFASPQGYYSPDMLKTVRRFFSSHRGLHTRTSETMPPSDPMRLRVIAAPTPDNAKSVATVTGEIDSITDEDGWAIIVVHGVAASPSGNQTSTADLDSIVDHCNTNSIPVRPVSGALAGL